MNLDEHGLVVRSPPRPPPHGPRSVAECLDAGLEAHPDREALVGRHARYSFAALDRAADRAADALSRLGVGAGDRVAMSLPNQSEIAVAFLAAMRLGAIWVGVGRNLAPPEKRHILADCGARTLICTPTIASEVGDAVDEVRVVDPETGTGDWIDLVAAADADLPPTPIDPQAPAAIAYTSGTTGRPKGAVHTQHNMLWIGASSIEIDPPDAAGRHGVLLPMTLLNLQILGVVASAIRGETCVAVDRVDPLGLAHWIRRERITRMIAVPTMLYDLLTHPDVDPSDLATLKRPECGGSHTPQVVRDLFVERFGQPVRTGYGLTEAPASVAREPADEPAVPGSSGRARPPIEIVIVDDEGRELLDGEVGEICLRARDEGPWAGVYTPMLGYWNQPEATARALRDGMLHTDDLGERRGGHVFVRDRRSELIIRGGANVYPAEIERILHDDDRVAGAAVFGLPDERLGERVVAVVQPAPGAVLTEGSLAERCRAALARYKVPERFVVVDELPRNAMGKVLKRELPALVDPR